MSKQDQVIVKQIPVSDIDHSRSKIIARFESEAPESEDLSELVQSIKLSGIIEPIIIRPKGSSGYEVVAGNRRLRAAKIAKLQYVPGIVRDLDDIESRRIAFVENVIRKSLNGMQMAKGLAAMYQDVGISPEIAIKKVHRIKNELNISSTRTNIRRPRQPDGNPTDEFMQVFNAIPLSAQRQYVLLENVTHLTEDVQEHAEEANLTADKIKILTHTKLREHPKIQSRIIEDIRSKKVNINRAKLIANQAVKDLETGNLYEDEDGHVVSSSYREPEEKVTYTPDT